MAKQTINLGTAPSGTGGDTPRSAFTKAQANFDELYGGVLAAVTTPSGAIAALGIGSAGLDNVVPVVRGGTGGTTQAAGRVGLGLKSASVADILGTVSQASGIPTGALFETGSNASGNWVKYADGTMICWSNSRPLGNLAAPLGAIYYTGSQAWTFPQSFVASPAVAAHISSTVGYSWVGLGSGATSASAATFSGFSATSTTGTPTFSAIAVGRWF